MHRNQTAQALFVAILLLTAAFMLFLNLQMPLAGEDYGLQPWGYNYSLAPFNLSDRLHAMWGVTFQHAVLWSPRIGEALAILIAAFPNQVFDVVNTLVFIWLIITLFVLGFGRFPHWSRSSDAFAAFALVFLLITLCPLFGSIFIWKSGTTNHTWGLIFLLSFMLPFRINLRRPVEIHGAPAVLGLSVLGLLAGLSVENASAVVLASLLLYVILPRRKTRLHRNFLIPVLAFAIGVMTLLFSPGTAARRTYYAGAIDYGALQGAALISERLRRIGHDFSAASWPLLVAFGAILAVYLVVVWRERKSGRGEASPVPRDGLPLRGIFLVLLVAALSILIMAAIAYHGDQRRGFEFFWLMMISLAAFLMTEIWNRVSSSLVRLLVVLSLLAMLVIQAWQMGKVYTKLQAENQARLALIFAARASHSTEVTLPALTVRDSRILETREILADLGSRMARYWGLKVINIQK